MLERFEIEEIILGMAGIVRENRYLRMELEEAKRYEKKYNDLIDQNVKMADESSRALLTAIIDGAFATR